MDPYVYPGTSVLRNLREIRDARQLDSFEAIATSRRIIELHHEPIHGCFDARQLQAIHHHIFQDVYEWSGKFRTVNTSKSSASFAFHQHIASSLDRMCEELEREQHLTGIDRASFATRGAYYLGELNAIHPFRDGNGRTQREFIRVLGLRSQLMIDWSLVSRDEMIEASRRSIRVDNTGLERILRKALDNDPDRRRDFQPG